MVTSKEYPDELPSDSEPVLEVHTLTDNGTTITIDDSLLSVDDCIYGDGSSDYNIDWNDITINSSRDLHVEGDIISRKGSETLNVTEIIHEQKLQIESLTDMIQEMIENKTFDIEWDLEKRVEQKKFLNKLSGD